MENLLALTLADETPEQKEGDGPSFRWRWLGRGVLELTPTTDSELSLLLSTGIHGNETAPVEIVDLLRACVISRRYHPYVSYWWCWAIRLRWRKTNVTW